MSEGDDGPPGPSARHLDGIEEPSFKDVEQPGASWSTLDSPLPPDEALESVAAGIERFRAPYTLRKIRSGFVLRTAGKTPFIAEVALTGWEEGTRIHVALPRGVAGDAPDATALREFLQASLRWGARQRRG